MNATMESEGACKGSAFFWTAYFFIMLRFEDITQFAEAVAGARTEYPTFNKSIKAEVEKRLQAKTRLTQVEIAKRLSTKTATLTDWVKEGEFIRYYPIGRGKLFVEKQAPEDLDHYHGTDRMPWYRKSIAWLKLGLIVNRAPFRIFRGAAFLNANLNVK